MIYYNLMQLQIQNKHNTKNNPYKKLSFQYNKCIICDNFQCQQSSDHNFVNFWQFRDMAMRVRLHNVGIQQVKNKVEGFYKQMHKNIKRYIQQAYVDACQVVNRLYYMHIDQLQSAQIKILCQVIQNDTRSLPSKKIYRIASTLKKIIEQRETGYNILPIINHNITESFKLIQDKIKSFDLNSFKQVLKRYTLNLDQISNKDKSLKQNNKKLRNLKSNMFSQNSNNEQQIVEWRNFKIRNRIKNVALNCKKIDDGQFLLNVQKFGSFSNIVQFQARQNKLTHISCTSISNFLIQLNSLDLRNNNIGNLGIQKLKNMHNLKQFMVSQNQLTDQCIPYLVEGYVKLEVLWADQNKITQKGILLLSGKQILKACSMIGNRIDTSYYCQIKAKFARKGLIYI